RERRAIGGCEQRQREARDEKRDDDRRAARASREGGRGQSNRQRGRAGEALEQAQRRVEEPRRRDRGQEDDQAGQEEQEDAGPATTRERRGVGLAAERAEDDSGQRPERERVDD